MKSMKTLSITILLSFAISVFGQQSETSKEDHYIEVTGIAEKEVIPDEIYISISIEERQEGKKKKSIEEQETGLKEALKSINVSLDNLSLSNANANYIRVKWRKKDVTARSYYVLKVENALTVGRVFEKLDELKIEGAYISKVSHSKILELKKEVRIMAIKAAKEKADYLLEAIGQQTGQALNVYEENNNYRKDESHLNVRGSRSGSSEFYVDGVLLKQSKNAVIQFKKIKLQASIYVKFEIN